MKREGNRRGKKEREKGIKMEMQPYFSQKKREVMRREKRREREKRKE